MATGWQWEWGGNTERHQLGWDANRNRAEIRMRWPWGWLPSALSCPTLAPSPSMLPSCPRSSRGMVPGAPGHSSARPRQGQYLHLICKRFLPPDNGGAAARTGGRTLGWVNY